MRTPMTRLFPMTLLSLALVACTPDGDPGDPNDPGADYDSSVRGRIGDDSGQGLLGSEGALSAVTSVQLMAVSDDGSLTLVSEAEVDAEGRYETEAPSNEDRMILQGVDAAGEVMAMAILEVTAEEDAATTATPMNRESTAEARVFIELLVQGADREDVNTIDLRSRVDAEVAARVEAAEEAGEDSGFMISALAEAVASAQASEQASWEDRGDELTQADAFWIELAAAEDLNLALHEGEPSALAVEAFVDAVIEAYEDAGQDAERQAEAELMASAALGLVLEARERGDSEGDEEVYEAAVLASAQLSAVLTGRSADAQTRDGDARGDARAELMAAVDLLVEDVEDADAEPELDEAYADYRAELFGQSGLFIALLGDDNVVSELLFELMIEGAERDREAFEAALRADVRSYVSGHDGEDFDSAAVADIMLEARGDYEGSLWTSLSLSELTLSDDDAALFVSLYVESSAHYSAD